MVPSTLDTSSSLRFLCPVETCQRACKTKAGWTAHLHSVHPHLDFSQFQTRNTVVNLPRHTVSLISTHSDHRRDLASSPLGDKDAYAGPENDFEMWQDIILDNAIGDGSPRSSPLWDYNTSGRKNDCHSVINGKWLVSFIALLIDNLQVDHATRMVVHCWNQ